MTEETTTDMKTFVFTFSFRVGGLIESSLDIEEVREHLTQDLAGIYGEDGFNIEDLREAEGEELEALAELKGPAPTIN